LIACPGARRQRLCPGEDSSPAHCRRKAHAQFNVSLALLPLDPGIMSAVCLEQGLLSIAIQHPTAIARDVNASVDILIRGDHTNASELMRVVVEARPSRAAVV
jgi:hypothetical protein